MDPHNNSLISNMGRLGTFLVTGVSLKPRISPRSIVVFGISKSIYSLFDFSESRNAVLQKLCIEAEGGLNQRDI